MHGQAAAEDIDIHRLIIHDEETGWGVHRGPPAPADRWHLRQVGADGGQQRAWIEGFGDVAVTPGLPCLDVIPTQGVRGHRNDRDVPERRVGFDAAGRFVAIDAGQVEVHEDEVGAMRDRGAHALVAGAWLRGYS